MEWLETTTTFHDPNKQPERCPDTQTNILTAEMSEMCVVARAKMSENVFAVWKCRLVYLFHRYGLMPLERSNSDQPTRAKKNPKQFFHKELIL